jgi:hypothetical protein
VDVLDEVDLDAELLPGEGEAVAEHVHVAHEVGDVDVVAADPTAFLVEIAEDVGSFGASDLAPADA